MYKIDTTTHITYNITYLEKGNIYVLCSEKISILKHCFNLKYKLEENLKQGCFNYIRLKLLYNLRNICQEIIIIWKHKKHPLNFAGILKYSHYSLKIYSTVILLFYG